MVNNAPSRSIFYYFNTFLVRLFCKYRTFFKRLFLIYTRPWSRKMHFFIRFREQCRATAHDFVVAHVEKKQYLCRRNWRSYMV